MRILLLLITSLYSTITLSYVLDIQTDNYNQIEKIYQQQKAHNKTLLIFDIDDTLVTMSQDLGSVGWWDWQSELSKQTPLSDLLFTKDKTEMIAIQNVLFQLIQMQTTDENVISFLKDVTKNESRILALTARGSEHINVTVKQLLANNFTDNGDLLFDKYAPNFVRGTADKSAKLECPSLTHQPRLADGIVYLAGQDKGKAILCLLEKTTTPYTNIFFVDDAVTNIDSVRDAFKNKDKFTVYNIWFTKENLKQSTFNTDPVRQRKSFKQWTTLKQAFNTAITHPVYQ